MTRLSDRDLRGVRELVHATAAAKREEPFGHVAVELLACLFPGDSIGYYEWSLERPYRLHVKFEVPEEVVWSSPDVAAATAEHCTTYPLSNVHLRAETRPRRISDFITLRELHRLEYYDYVLRPFGIEHQVRLFLPAPPMESRVFYFNRQRADGDFGRRDVELLAMLRPFLSAFREQLDVSRPTARANEYGLTSRELEVLEWVGRGKRNHEIAALLVVSPHTVRTHLENIYEKLGVHSRTAALAAVGIVAETGGAQLREAAAPAA